MNAIPGSWCSQISQVKAYVKVNSIWCFQVNTFIGNCIVSSPVGWF